MTGPAAPAAPHTDAFAAAIAAGGLLVDRGQIPEGGGWQGAPGSSTFVPFAVLWPSPGRTGGASLAKPHDYLDYTVQVTCVAATSAGAETAMDIVRGELIDQRLTIDGRASHKVQMPTDRPSSRDDSVTPPLHYAVGIFTVRTEPA